MTEMRNVYEIMFGKSLGMVLLEKARCRQETNTENKSY